MSEAQQENAQGFRRRLVGRVVNDTTKAGRMQKTVVVEVVRRYRDPVYGKYVKRSTKFHAHDENNECSIGDLVTIEECRPISKSKFWRLVRIEEKSKG